MNPHTATTITLAELAAANVGASINDRLALIALAYAPAPMQMGELADSAQMSRGGTTALVKRLADQKLVRTTRSSSADLRAVYVEVTKRGLQVLRRAEKRAGLGEVMAS